MFFKRSLKIHSYQSVKVLFAGFALFCVLTADAYAGGANPGGGINVSAIADNLSGSFTSVPGLFSAVAYLLGLLFAALGVLAIKDHVESSQTPLKKGVIRLVVGGMLLALPFMSAVVQNSISGGGADGGVGGGATGRVSDLMSSLGLGPSDAEGLNFGGLTINGIFFNLSQSLGGVTGILSTFSYLIGLLMLLLGILKIKEHVDNPDSVTLKEPLVRLLIAGAFLALPFIFSAITGSVTGGVDGASAQNVIDANQDILDAGETDDSDCRATAGGTLDGLGQVICRVTGSTVGLPFLLSVISYIFGLVIAFWGLFKIRDHGLNPSQTSLWDGLIRFIVGGLFLALPLIVYAVRNSFINDGFFGDNNVKSGEFNTESGGAVTCGDGGLDTAIFCFTDNIYGPANVIITVFSVLAGLIFIMIGISRLLKTTQEGAKGPMGIGTIMTFVTGAALLSTNYFLKAFSQSMFNADKAASHGTLEYTDGLTTAETAHIHTVIGGIMMFMGIVGFVSFVRGIFIMREVSEGGSQASMMAGMTHLIGGALAINLGPLLTAVQATLGIAQYGIKFIVQ